MISFLAVAFQSAVEFSVQTQAVAFLAVVICAQLVSLNRSDPTVPPSAAHPRVLTLRFSPLGLGALAVGALALGGVLILHAWKADQVYRFRLGAFRALQRDKPPDLDRAVTYLQSAIRRDPTNPDLQLELGQVYLDRIPEKTSSRLPEAVVPGLRHMIAARNVCPILPRPHMRLAAHATELAKADPPEVYWQRAERLASWDPDLWYLHGVELLKSGKKSEAWACWRRSLELSPNHLKDVVTVAYPQLKIDGLLANVLPGDPAQLVKTAELLEPGLAGDTERLKPLYTAALKALDERDEDLSPLDQYLKALSAEQLGEIDKALRAYKQALEQTVDRHDWRWRYAKLLHRANKLQDAMVQLKILRQVFPDRADIKQEYETVQREIVIE
jgi:tetratricopeptide (TPR) repeat protein